MSAPAPVGNFRHEALLYADQAEFVAGTVPFITAGLEAGEPVLVVESPEKIELLRQALGVDAGSVTFADMAGVGANPARIIPAWRDFVDRHRARGGRLRGIGEPIWKGRTADELAECQRHESLLNVAFGHGRPWWLLCPYDTAKLHPSVIEEARRSHEFVSHGGCAAPSPLFRGIEASGLPFAAPLPSAGANVRELAFGPDGLPAVRRLAERAAADARLEAVRASGFVIAANEVATNCLRHGGGAGTMRVWLEGNRLLCELSDAGRYDLPLGDRERPGRDARSRRGLWLANQLCDLVQIRTFATGTVVRLHMRTSPRPHLHVVADPPPPDRAK